MIQIERMVHTKEMVHRKVVAMEDNGHDDYLLKWNVSNDSIQSQTSSPWPFGLKARIATVAMAVLLSVTAAVWITLGFEGESSDNSSPSGYWVETMTPSFQIIESIPVSDYDLDPIPTSMGTHDAEIKMLNEAKHTIDVTVMYWNLLPLQDQKNCNETAGGLSYETCRDDLGGKRGEDVYKAFQDAAKRGVEVSGGSERVFREARAPNSTIILLRTDLSSHLCSAPSDKISHKLHLGRRNKTVHHK